MKNRITSDDFPFVALGMMAFVALVLFGMLCCTTHRNNFGVIKKIPTKIEPIKNVPTVDKLGLQIVETYEADADMGYFLWIIAYGKDGKMIAKFFRTENTYPDLMIFYYSGKCSCADAVVGSQPFNHDFIVAKEIDFNDASKENAVRLVEFNFFSSWEVQKSGKLKGFFDFHWGNEFEKYKFYCAGYENKDLVPKFGSEDDCKKAEEDLNYWKSILEWDKRVPRILKENGK
jgi:hypothetical protein